ncbi:MAG: hypothetical protein ABR881_30405 [Candidatus Sulfotelmatobacter sp.]
MYYNTTGIDIAGTIRQRPQIVGYARFNGCGGFNPNRPSQMINRVFECEEPCVWLGQNKILFNRLLNAPAKPDVFLVVVRPQLVGKLAIGRTDWRSAGTWLISFSECGDQQEAMLLMPALSWLQTELGPFVLEPEARRPWVARLVLASV